MPTAPLDLTTNVRFGKLTTNLAIVAVNAETVIAFLKKVNKVSEAETIAKAKDDIVLEFVACHLLWRHLGLRFWNKSAKETTMDSYRRLITDFHSCAESIKVSASPAIFITSVRNTFRDETDASSAVPGFSALVTSLADSEQSSIELNRHILSKLEVFVQTFEHFKGITSDEKRRSDARKSAHETLRTIDEIQERDAYKSKIELLTTIAIAKKSWPLNAHQVKLTSQPTISV